MSALRTCAVLLALCTTAFAHDVHGTQILLDVGRNDIDVEVQIPLSELALVVSNPLQGAKQYVAQHFAVDGVAADVQSMSKESINGINFIRFYATVHPVSTRRFTIASDLVDERVVSHNLYILLRNDPWGGFSGGEPRFLGFMHYQRKTLQVDLGASTVAHAFVSLVRAHTDAAIAFVLCFTAFIVVGIARRSRGRLARSCKAVIACTNVTRGLA